MSSYYLLSVFTSQALCWSHHRAALYDESGVSFFFIIEIQSYWVTCLTYITNNGKARTQPKLSLLTDMLKRLKNVGREFFICLSLALFFFYLNLKLFGWFKYPKAKWLSSDVSISMCLMSKTFLWGKSDIKGKIKASNLDIISLGNQVDDHYLLADDSNSDFQNRKPGCKT